MTATDHSAREQRVSRLFAVLHRQIAAVNPGGLGHWEPAWLLVAEPSNALLDAAAAYERGETTERDVIEAAKTLRLAWEEAARRWTDAGKPGAPRRNAEASCAA